MRTLAHTSRGLKIAALLPVCAKDPNYQHGTPVIWSIHAAPCPVHAGVKEEKSFSIKMGRERKLNALRSTRDSRAGHETPRISALFDVSMF